MESRLINSWRTAAAVTPSRLATSAEDHDICAQYDVFLNAPTVNGDRANGVQIDRGGQLTWRVGDLGNLPVIELDSAYAYIALGWTLTIRDGALHYTSAADASGFITAHGVTVTQ